MEFNIPEKMQNWHTWEDIVKDSDPDYLSEKLLKSDYTLLPEKMQNWHTWEDIVKDSDPFIDYLNEKLLKSDYTLLPEELLKDDFTLLAEFDVLKKVVARLEAEFNKVFEEGRPARDAHVAAVKELFKVYKMIDDRDKFENLLASDTVLHKVQKSMIKLEWEEHHASRTKVVKCLECRTKEVECLGSETIEECLKRKSVEFSEARSKVELLQPRIRMISKFVQRAEDIQRWTEVYIDARGLSPLPPPPPSPSPSPSPSSSPTSTRVRDNIGSSSSPPNKRVKHESFASTVLKI